MFAWFGQAVEAVQLGAHAVEAVGKAMGEFLRRRVAPQKQIASRGLGETGTPATWIEGIHILQERTH